MTISHGILPGTPSLKEARTRVIVIHYIIVHAIMPAPRRRFREDRKCASTKLHGAEAAFVRNMCEFQLLKPKFRIELAKLVFSHGPRHLLSAKVKYPKTSALKKSR